VIEEEKDDGCRGGGESRAEKKKRRTAGAPIPGSQKKSRGEFVGDGSDGKGEERAIKADNKKTEEEREQQENKKKRSTRFGAGRQF